MKIYMNIVLKKWMLLLYNCNKLKLIV